VLATGLIGRKDMKFHSTITINGDGDCLKQILQDKYCD